MAVATKIAGVLVALLLLAFAASLSGLTFVVWPTSLNDVELKVGPDVLSQLAALKDERKFDADPATFYPGAPDEATRARAQAVVDGVITSLISNLPSAPKRSNVLRTFKTALGTFTEADSEERDQCLAYLERIMKIVGVDSSGELLNVWRYGMPYGWFIKT